MIQFRQANIASIANENLDKGEYPLIKIRNTLFILALRLKGTNSVTKLKRKL